MNERHVARRGPARHRAGRFGVDAHGKLRLILGLVDGGVGGRIEDDVRRQAIERAGNGLRRGEIEHAAVGRQHRRRCWQPRDQRAADLPANACHQNAHHTGSKRGNISASSASVRPSLSRADRIGSAMPQSMPSAGSFQRSTFSSAGL